MSNENDRQHKPTARDSSVHQSRRDVERDRYVCNGTELAGAEIGFDGVVQQIAGEILLKARGSKLVPALTEKNAKEFAMEVLLACNRTQSGGDSYDLLEQLLVGAMTSDIILVPDSESAPPLTIAVDVSAESVRPCMPAGANRPAGEGEISSTTPQWVWGVVCTYAAATVYNVCQKHADGDICPVGSIEVALHGSLAMRPDGALTLRGSADRYEVRVM